MTLSPGLTWPTLTENYATAIWPPLAPLARTYYAQQARLLPAANYLALSPTSAAEPFIGSLAASELVRAALPATGPAEETYLQYVSRGAAEAQPLLTRLIAVLSKRSITLADFKQALSTPEASYYLLALLGPEFWTPVTAAWQQQVQQRLDDAGRWQQLLDTQLPDEFMRSVLFSMRARLLTVYPTASIESLSGLPLNEVAHTIWSPNPTLDAPALARLLDALQVAAQEVIMQNYLESELTEQLLAAITLDLVPFAQVLLGAAEGQTALTTLTELASVETLTIANRLVALPANHPLVYALAAWFQSVLQRFISAQVLPTPIIPTNPLVIRGQLRGTDSSPLPDFKLQLTQILASREEAVRPLGELRTAANGRFALEIARDWYLDDNDEVAEAPAHVRAAVYYPAQDVTGAPVTTLELSTENTEVTYQTDVLPTLPPPASRSLDSLELPQALRQLLEERGLTTLAEVRATGSLGDLVADLLPEDMEAAQAADRVDGLAQFEVVGQGDAAFQERVVDLGFYSLSQLLAASSEEFVAQLVGETGSEELQAQGAAFYQQVSAVQALSQALGLLAAGARASGTSPVNPATSLTTTFASFSSVDYDSESNEDEAGDGFTSSAANSSRTTVPVPGYTLDPQYNPAPAGNPFSYDSSQQCDCPACRSAVSPTAYLAALLKYATDSLRVPAQAGLPAGPVAIADLQAKFQQPFMDLRVSCQSAQEQVCQYRLAIEVIQSYCRSQSWAPLQLGQARPYVEAMLNALLQALGTSLFELQATPPADLPDLAARLSLPKDVLLDLTTRFSAASLADARPLPEVEAALEECFGLVSTSRDPLSTGLLLSPNTNATKLVRWSFEGIAWGVNTDEAGQLQLELVDGQSRVVVYRGAKAEDNVVARGTLSSLSSKRVIFGNTPVTMAAVLYPQHDSGLRGSVVVQRPGLVTSVANPSFTLAVVPTVTAGQLQDLQASWLSQDAATIDLLPVPGQATLTGSKFLIDPDLLGPDDFRPLDRGRRDLRNNAYIIWRRRYEFLQNELPLQVQAPVNGNASAKLGDTLDGLTQNLVNYGTVTGGLIQLIPWQAASHLTGTVLLAQVQAGLTTSAASMLLASVHLSAEAVQRLYDLWQQSRAADLKDEETQEAVDIIRQSVKKAFEASWVLEEQATIPAPLTLNLFQSAVHEPQPGSWEKVRPAEFGLGIDDLPRIDPDEVTPLDLPDDGMWGYDAAIFWKKRQAELLGKLQAVLNSGKGIILPLDRADSMLAYAYRPDPAVATAGLPGAPPYATLELNWAAYQNQNDPLHQAASDYFNETLALRPAEAERLLALRQLVLKATDGIWQEMATLLTLAWKRAVAYRQSYVVDGTTNPVASWMNQEMSMYGRPGLDFLISTRKHHLVKWRTSAATRAVWVQALTQLTQRPLIDPDQLVPGDFLQAGERSRNVYIPALAPADQPYLNPAYEVYARRKAQVENWFTTLVQNWPTGQTGQWGLVADILYSSQRELAELHRQQGDNADVSAALRRLCLTPAGLDLLYNQIENPTTTDRLTELYHLLVQVMRTRTYASWKREEIALGIISSPQYFREPRAEVESLATVPWRSSAAARREWQRNLSTRFDQAAALTTAREQAVHSAEDQYLGMLRDVLIDKQVQVLPAGFDSKADWLNSEFLLDFKVACCQHTTRVAQAIEVLQKQFTNVRGGLANNNLELNSDTFEQDWQWLSSYERWRSLMFLYLYPQNVLLPALKPGQTSQFKQTVSAIRQAAGITPADARGYMDDYQAYLADMGTLQIATSTETSLSAVSTDGFTTAGARQRVGVQVALADSRRAYANIFTLTSTPTDGHFTWNRLPGTALVERVVGSTVYQPQNAQRYVYVFTVMRDEQKNTFVAATLYLAFQRLNLTTLTWDEDYTRLNISDTSTLDVSSVQVVSGGDETWAPVVLGLRNKRVLHYDEYPFSQKPNVVAGVEDTGSQLELYRVLDESDNHYNVDLFFGILDLSGTGIGLEQTRTIFLCVSAQLLASIRRSSDRIMLWTALGIGSYKNITLTYFTIKLTNYGTQTRYLIASDFRIPGAFYLSSPRSGSTTLFSSGSLGSFYFVPVISNISAALTSADYPNDPNPRFVIENWGRTLNSSSANSANIIQPLVLAPRLTKLTQGGARLNTAQVATTPGGGDLTFTIHYNLYPNVTATTGFTTYSLIFSVSGYDCLQYGSSVTPSQVPLPYSYQGPTLRSGYPATESAKPTISVSETNNGRYPLQRGGKLLTVTGTYSLHGVLDDLPPIFSQLTIGDLTQRHNKLVSNMSSGVSFNNVLISEAYYALPMLLAQELTRGRNYELALHYYRLVYDYTRQPSVPRSSDLRLVYPGLYNANAIATYNTALSWLEDPNNPYPLAALRPDSHLHYVVMSVARCLLAYADTEFTADTTESVSRARTLYELVARLLKQDITQFEVVDCASLLDPIDASIPAAWLAEWQALKSVLGKVNQRNVLEELLNQVVVDTAGNHGITSLFKQAAQGQLTWDQAFNQAWVLVNGQLATLPKGYLTLGASQMLSQDVAVPISGMLPGVGTPRPYVPFLGINFCVPTNPVPFALALQAELNLFKIRSCRNISGVQRELDAYAAATDNTTGLPTLSSTGQLSRSARLIVPATPFRYAYIIERARQIVALAQQTETSLLAALEKRDAEAYNQFKARQDIAVSQATVQLQTLRVTEAEDGVDLTGLQLERSEIMETQYTDWLNEGLNGWEEAQLIAIGVAGYAKVEAAMLNAAGSLNIGDTFTFGATAAAKLAAGIAESVAAIAEATAQISGIKASYERREQEWNFQKNLAAQDIKINQQQIKIANDQVKVVGQEKRISQLQLDHATAVLTFLTTKFTNAELYDWMSGILQSAYSYFLQQATATARLAEQQLAFERQQVPAGIVQADYYSDPTDDVSSETSFTTSTGSTTDRRGLTGSVRLLQDLTRLDEYAFETTKRKLQLTKTISLAQSFPTEFVRFRDTGVLPFACQPEWFDQDFPGHYLRVLRRVRTSVIALVPTVDSIKARLSTAGTSHVVVDGAPFQTLTLPRAQEAVALTSPSNATGLFELDPQSSELLLPFEGLGVDVPWQFSMQPASNPSLDYSAIADVLVTLDYTALESVDYARQVVKQLGTERQQQVVLSMRNRFADEWYDLHHADELAPADQYVSKLTIAPSDLPLRLRNARVSQVSLFVDAPLDEDVSVSGAFTDRSQLELRLTRKGGIGGAAFTNQYGLISTRTGLGAGPLYTGNAAAFTPLIGSVPAGDWTLAVGPGRLRARLDAGLVNDIYLIIEIEGDAPAYVL